MTVTERSWSRLVIEDGSWRWSAALAATGALAGVLLAHAGRPPWAVATPPAFLLLMAWLAGYHALTTLDRDRGVIRHELRRVGRRTVQEHPLADVVEVGVRQPPLSRTRQHWLLQIGMRDGAAFWASPATARRATLEPLADEIRAFVGLDTPTSPEERVRAQVRAMVHAGDRLGAIKLLRATAGLSLAEAERRVDALAR